MSTVALQVDRLLGELRQARRESDRLFSIIKPESLYDRPIDARHRVLFYIGHLDGFDSIQICREGLGIASPDPVFDHLFQAGIDPDSGNLPTDEPSDWPALSEVHAYVQRCREHVDRYLEQAPEELLYMALEHRLMHIETLAYMFHNFGYDRKVAPDTIASVDSNAVNRVENEWCEIPAGAAILGKPADESFGWDNEFKQHSVEVPAFRIEKYPVTNGAYLEFVQQTGAGIPQFWAKHGETLFLRGMLQEFQLPLDWPVYVTLDQARAYAAWCGKRVMSEAEFHRAAYGTSSRRMNAYPWGNGAPSEKHGNFGFRSWDPQAVHANPAGASFFGVEQLVGNGWEWTDTAFGPFSGFEPRPSYPGYSSNFFDGEHFVMKGGSPRTATRLFRSSFRNWFRHDYPYMYAKFRCVEDL